MSKTSESFLADFGINAAEVLSKTRKQQNQILIIPKSLIFNSIVLSATMFGSVFLFSTSLIGVNKMWIKNAKCHFGSYEIFNGIVMCCSGLVMCITAVKSLTILKKM